MKVNSKGLELIKHFESLHDGDLTKIGLQPKLCPANVWTEGWGHAIVDPVSKRFLKGAKDKDLAYKLSRVKTVAEADALLIADMPPYEAAVLKLIKRRDLTEDQYSSLVSFCYNCGTHYRNYLGINTPFAIWKKVDQWDGKDHVGLFNYWSTSVTKAGGKVLPGLVRRRKAEAHLFLTGTLKFTW